MAKTKIDRELERAFKTYFDRVPIPMMDIPKIMRRARVLVSVNAQDANQVMHNLASEYKVKAREDGRLDGP